jgi:ribonuclease HII
MIEDKIWREDPNKYIIGVDEVGRGSFAGPISAAAVRVNYYDLQKIGGIKDSKKLSEKKRNEIYNLVLENNINFSYNSCSNKAIDLYGIKTANEKVLKDSINDLFKSKDLVYVDHFKIDKFNAVSVIKGEDNCLPIALASIVAKVLRDEFMKNLPVKYEVYNLYQNKGYGTKEHRDAIKKYGITDLHRKSFSLMPK